LLACLGACERASRDSTSPATSTVGAPARALNATSLAVIKEALASKDYATRLIAVEALGDAKADVLVPWLEHALGDPEHDVRMAAVEALEKVRSPRASAVLATVRDDASEDLDIRALAASALLQPDP
jgi:HEAT repeat protein